jgi:hypothetical protein
MRVKTFFGFGFGTRTNRHITWGPVKAGPEGCLDRTPRDMAIGSCPETTEAKKMWMGTESFVNLLALWEEMCTFRGPTRPWIATSKRANLPRQERNSSHAREQIYNICVLLLQLFSRVTSVAARVRNEKCQRFHPFCECRGNERTGLYQTSPRVAALVSVYGVQVAIPPCGPPVEPVRRSADCW